MRDRAVFAAFRLIAVSVVAERQIAIDPQFVALGVGDDVADIRAADPVAIVGIRIPILNLRECNQFTKICFPNIKLKKVSIIIYI